METFATFTEAQTAFLADMGRLRELGIDWHPSVEPKAYLPARFGRNSELAMDALPTLSTDPNSAVPSMLTTFIDPEIYRVLFQPLAAVEIYGEQRKGNWVMDTTMFPIVEHTGELTSYGDYAMGGRAGVNTNWPNFQNYLFQLFKEYGEREIERAGLSKLNWVGEIDMSAATIMARGMNTIYHFGIAGLNNYGLANNPFLSAPLTPATKAAGGATWFTSGGAPNAQANEVYNDVLALFQQLVTQTGGLVNADTKMVLAISNTVVAALNFTNSFNVSVKKLLTDNFKNLRIVQDTLFAVKSSTNPSGLAGGNLIQLIAEDIEGQKTGFCAFSEKLRTHKIVAYESSFRQKVTAGSWGTILRMPFGVAQMLGV